MRHRCPLIISLCLTLFVTGCAVPSIKQITLTQAHKKLEQILKNDYELDIVLFPEDNTLWIYLPISKDIMILKAKKEGPKFSSEAAEALSVKFVEGDFLDGVFTVDYDIGYSRGYAKDYGYASNFTEEYQQMQQHILTAVNRVYTEMENVESVSAIGDPDARAKREALIKANVPHPAAEDFIVIVVADITNGLETEMLVAYSDLTRAMVDQSFHEEYAKRVISDYPIGNTAIIDDKEGHHLSTYNISWGEFLSRQMASRIRFAYERSQFPPSDNTEEELPQIVAQALRGYDFEDYTSVVLHDLNSGSEQTLFKEDLAALKTPQGGKLHFIQFR